MMQSLTSNQDLSKLVFQDELTDLYNRRYLQQYLNEKVDWNNPKKTPAPLSLLMMDLDFFKEINDSYGHLAGDNALKHLSKIIKESVTANDIPIRYAGDEFTVLLPATDKKKAKTIAETIRKNIEKTPFKAKEKEIKLQISIGLASFPIDAHSAAELIDSADKALYFSKRQGKNMVSIAGEEDKNIIAEKDILKNFPPPFFIGRDNILEEINKSINEVKEGKNAFVLIEGTTGIGKTRLLKELNKSCEKDFISVFFQCTDANSLIPYKPIINLISKAFADGKMNIDKVWDTFSATQQTEFKKLFPNLPEKLQTKPIEGTITEEQKRRSVFEALASVLTHLSEQTPVLFLIDEMYNIDEGSMEVINYLNSSDTGRVIFCSAMRSTMLDTLEAKHPKIDSLLNEIAETECFKHITLDPIDEATTSEFISKLLPNRPANSDFDKEVFNVTKGNPLFIEELIKYFILAKHIALKDGNWVIERIPPESWHPNVERIIQDNFLILDKTTAELINQASVAGVQVDFSTLKSLAGKNEGEVLELIDKAKKLGLVTESGSMQMDQFDFINQYIQELTYKNIDGAAKQAIHGEIARVTEEANKDNLDGVASLLSHHFKQAGNTEQAGQYAVKAQASAGKVFRSDEAGGYYEHGKMIIRSKIKEAMDPLNEPAMKLMKDILRGLSATAKNIRLYPEGSQLITNTTGALVKTLDGIFQQSGKITLSEMKNVLYVNGSPADAKAFGAAATEFVALLRNHYIKSCTIQKGVLIEEILSFVKDLDESRSKNYSMAGYWNDFLDSKHIINIGIAQRAFVAKTSKVSSHSKAASEENKIEINSETTPLIRDILRFLTAAIDNIRLYPSGSQLSTQALQNLHQALAKLFLYVEVIELGEVEDNLLINGNLLNPKIFGLSIQTLVKLIRDQKMKSISINRATSAEELEKALRLINNPPEGVQLSPEEWVNIFTVNAIGNVIVGQTTYSVSETKKGQWRKSGKEGAGEDGSDEVTDQGDAEPDLAKEAQSLIKGVPDKLISIKFLEIANQLAQSNTLKQMVDLIDRFIENFKSTKPELRTQSLFFYANSFDKMSDPVKEYLIKHATPILAQIVKSEQGKENQGPLLLAVYQTVLFHLKQKKYDDAISLFSGIGRESAGLAFLTDDIKKERWKTIEKLTQTENFSSVMEDLKNPEVKIQSSAILFLSVCGHTVTHILLQKIKESDELSDRELFANLINQAGPEAIGEYASELTSITDAELLQRLLSVLAIINPPDIGPTLTGFLKNRNESIRNEALNAIKSLPKETSLPILIGALKAHEETALLAANILTELQYKEAVDGIIELFDRISEKVKVCHILGKLGAPNAVHFLTGILFKKGFLGFGWGYSEEIRGGAAWGLGHIKTPESNKALERALKDKSAQVRSAAKLGLNK